MNRYAQWKHRHGWTVERMRHFQIENEDRRTIGDWYRGKMLMLREMTAAYLDHAGNDRRRGDKEMCRFHIEQARRHRTAGCRKLAID